MRITVEKTDSGSKIDLFFSGKRSFCKRQNQEAQCKNPLFNVVFHPSCGHGLLCALTKAKHHETLVKQLQLFELQISTTNLSPCFPCRICHAWFDSFTNPKQINMNFIKKNMILYFFSNTLHKLTPSI